MALIIGVLHYLTYIGLTFVVSYVFGNSPALILVSV